MATGTVVPVAWTKIPIIMVQPLNVSQKDPSCDEETIVPLLAGRSCHLPGNNWRADWIQWFRNNHILFGICLHHPLHPLEWWERSLALAASVSFGLVATNIVYQLDQFDHERMSEELFSVDGHTVTKGMALLWTFGGLGHSIFDMFVWHVMACACCHPGGRWGDSTQSHRFKDCGSYALVPVVLGLLTLAAFFVLVRASEGEDVQDADTNISDIDGLKSFSFLTKYTIEVSLAWFVYFPLVGTLLFSGVLGCNGRLPILGGRPRDLKRVEDGRFGLFNQLHYASF
jgi:hypothetical protein